MADIEVLEGDGAIIVVANIAGQNSFDADFLAYTADTVKVTLWPDTVDEDPLALGVDFTVAGLAQPAGFTITLIGAYAGVIAINDRVLIFRDTPIKRLFDYQNAGDFRAETVNREFDTLTMIAQEARRDIELASRVPIGSAPVTIYPGAPGTLAVYDVNGDIRSGVSVADINQIVAILDDISAVAAISPAVVTVAANDARITIVGNAIGNVNIVGNNIASVITVAGAIANVNVVAGSIANVNTAAANMAAIIDAPNQASAAAGSALLASRFATYPVDTDIPGTGGLRSALHWAAKAAASAGITIAQWVGAVTGFAAKAAPADADLFGYVQASDTTGRSFTWANIKAALAGLFVRYDTATALSAAQQAQFRTNIGLDLGYPRLYVRDEKPSGTDGGSSVAGNQTRNLNTIIFNTIGATVSADMVTLLAGTYRARARAQAYGVNRTRLFLRNITDGNVTIGKSGAGQYTSPSSAVSVDAYLELDFTIAATKQIALIQYTELVGPLNGLGVAANSAGVEVYAELWIERLK